jgi:hypothetical protein
MLNTACVALSTQHAHSRQAAQVSQLAHGRDQPPPAPPAGDLEKSDSTQASPTEQGLAATRATRGGLGKIRKTKHSHVASGWSHIIHPCRIGVHCLEFVGLY